MTKGSNLILSTSPYHKLRESPVELASLSYMKYEFDAVGNVLGYENATSMHTTKQSYGYDGLYQLTSARGESAYHPYGSNVEYRADYAQDFSFSRTGNMTGKTSGGSVSNNSRIGADLNYSLDYAYYPGTHKAERIGNRYYNYDLNGNITAERDGGTRRTRKPTGFITGTAICTGPDTGSG